MLSFEYPDNSLKKLRVLVIDGKPWWVLWDLRKILGISAVNFTAKLFNDTERGYLTDGKAVLNGKGLARFFDITARRPNSERLKKWIEQDVIPKLPKTGGYSKSVIRNTFVLPTTPGTPTIDLIANNPSPAVATQKSKVPKPVSFKNVPPFTSEPDVGETVGEKLMDKPEVLGFSVECRVLQLDDDKYQVFYPTRVIADVLGMSVKIIDYLATDLELKNNETFGKWIPVQTSECIAREFMYTEDTVYKQLKQFA